MTCTFPGPTAMRSVLDYEVQNSRDIDWWTEEEFLSLLRVWGVGTTPEWGAEVKQNKSNGGSESETSPKLKAIF